MSEKQRKPEDIANLDDFVRNISDAVDAMNPNEQREFTLPSGVEFARFVCECGRIPRHFEIGGVFNSKTRSLILRRGFGANDQGVFSNPNVPFVAPRRDESDESDDEFWHTHPWTESANSAGKMTCLPSNEDNSSLLSVWLVEYEEGHKREVTSTIGCGGYISTTTARGINFDENKLLEMGINEKQLREVKSLLALGPPIWIGNLAVAGRGEELRNLVEKHYQKKHLQDGSFARDLDTLIDQAKPLLNKDIPRGKPSAEQRLREAIFTHLPQFFEKHRLTNVGITPDIADSIINMVGLRTEITEYPRN